MSPIDPQDFFHDPLQSLERLLSQFDNQGVIIGGIAVSLLGLARFTEDLGAMVPAKGDGKTTATVRGLCSYGNESKNE